MLDASRIITGKLRLDARPVILAAVVEAAAASARPSTEAKRIELVADISGAASLIVNGDAERLQQVIWDLLSNAIKFTPEGGRVSIQLERSGGEAQVVVTDTGAGIVPEFLPRVFDRFTQADSSTTRAYGGLGLGLSIARHLIELHGGSISAASAGDARGSTFTVRLPLHEPMNAANDARRGDGGAAQHLAASAAQQSAGVGRREAGDADRPAAVGSHSAALAGLRVLIVDDDPDTLLMLAKTLERYGAHADASESIAGALALLGREQFDVLVSDIGMPGEDGYALVRRLRALEAERGARALPALALTAYARKEDRDAALEAGFQAHVTKPVAPSELVGVGAAVTGRTSEVN